MSVKTFTITKDTIKCNKCGSTEVTIIPKMFTTYYYCKNCGNEDRE